MENQVGSINFDANALYLEEESEHEDDKQQDNEIKELISQGGLDGILDDDSMLSSSADSSCDESEPEQNHKQMFHQNQEHEHDMTVYNGIGPNQNYLINHFSTPANHNPPNPQMLQATAIPSLQEDKMFYRQRKLIEANKEFEKQDNTLAEIDPNDVTHANQDMHQYLNLQKQHYVPHNKMHSLERFAAPGTMHQIHEGIDENTEFRSSVESKSNKVPVASFGNGMQIEFTAKEDEISKKNGAHQNFPEASIIDLNELNEEQLQELHDEEQRQQQEYFSIDHLNRLYCQAQFLYKIRGKKLEEVSNRFAAYQEDMSREIRAMKHKLYLVEKEKESVQVSLDQAHDLCNQYKSETDEAQKTSADLHDKMEKLIKNNRILEQKLSDQEHEIDNLHLQITEQQKMDTLERMQEQHEHFIQQLREQYEKDLFQMKETLAKNNKELEDKHEFIRILRLELDTANRNSEMAQIETAEVVNKLTKNINDLQAKYNQDVIIAGLSKEKMNDESKNKLIEQLTEKCKELETELKKVLERTGGSNQDQTNDSIDFHISNLSNTLHMLSTNESVSTGSMKSLQNELERALSLIKQKRTEIQNYQLECEKLRSEIANIKQMPNDNNSKNEIERLNALIEELNREKNDLANELMDKNAKLDQLLDSEEQNQHLRSNLELELFNKQNHCHELEKIIDQLHQELNLKQQNPNQNSSLNEQKYLILINEYEAQINDLNLKISNRDNEVQKFREMYMEVCNDKNNLQDTLKQQYDEEYESKIKQKLDLMLANKLDEQKNALNEKWSNERTSLIAEYRKQIDSNLSDLKACREKLIASEKFNDQLRLDKANCELKASRSESEFKEKMSYLERNLKESEEKSNFEINSLKNELEIFKLKLDSEEKKTESALNDLRNAHELEKTKFLESIDLLEKEKVQLNERISEIVQKLNSKDLDLGELSKKEAQICELESSNSQKECMIGDLKNQIEQMNKKICEQESELAILGNNSKNTELKLVNEIENFKTLKNSLDSDIADLKKKNEELEACRIALATKKDEELQKCIEQLEKRFQEDYDTFLQTNKDNVEKALNEKTTEFVREKERLVEFYQKKLDEYDENEKNFMKKIKELKDKPKGEHKQCQTEQYDSEGDQEEYIGNLLERIRELEDILSNTDAHFEIELNKLRSELEEEYEIKLKQELNNVKLNDFRDESVEQSYRVKLEHLQERYQEHLNKMKEKYENELVKNKQILNENYRKALLKSKNEIENLQEMVSRYKKNSQDSDKIVESLKTEMKSMKESHLDEVTNLKLAYEKDKENLKENYEQAVKKIGNLEKELNNSDERFRNQLNCVKQQLKAEHGTEMSKLNKKMQDMMKSHSSAIEKLKKHHAKKYDCVEMSTNSLSQTEMSFKDIDLLEAFQKNYINTLSRIKSDVMNEFEEHNKSIKEFVREKIVTVFMPKIGDLLKEFRVSETMVRVKMDELEIDLAKILSFSETKKSDTKFKSQTENIESNLYSKSASILRDLESSDSDFKSVKKSGSIVLSSGYKYTPLRQSWSNLTQMNTLSPVSGANFESPITKKFLEENMSKTPAWSIKNKLGSQSGLILSQMEEESDLVESVTDDSNDKDCIYVDDCEIMEEKGTFFKKYQNIRQKKTQKNFSRQLTAQRPHSASNLTRSSSNFVPTQGEKNLSLARSNTNINSRQLNADIMRPKTNLNVYKTNTSRQSLFETDEELPIKLEFDSDEVMSEMSGKSSSKTRPSSSNLNGSTRSSSSLGIKTISSSTSAFCSHSLPRSRTPNRSIGSDMIGSGHYRSPTLSSINKSVTSSIENVQLSSNFNPQNSVSTTSTHYYSINSNIGTNLVKNSAPPLPQQPKKKNVFY